MSGTVRPVFGVGVSAAVGGDPVAAARAAEAAGFDFVSTSDHPGGTAPTYETWTLLTWLAAATERVAFLPRVLAVPLRPPAMIAKMAETFDRLSGGRLILGLGAGAVDAELRSFGAPAQTPGQKVAGLADAMRIARGLWTRPAYSHDGAVHRTVAADLTPKPARSIPIWVGTYGPRALAVTGQLADGWIPSLGYAPAAELPRMRERISAAAEQAGRDPAAVRSILNVAVEIGGAPDDGAITGTPDQITSTLATWLDRGFTGFNFLIPDPDQVQQLAEEVLPALSAVR